MATKLREFICSLSGTADRCARKRGSRAAVLVVAAGCASSGPAEAQFFSNMDGFAPDGTWRVQTELMPYAWLPATKGSLQFGNPRDSSISFSTGVPTAAELANTLRGAFMGAGLVRYGPFSTEIDIDYVAAGESRDLPSGRTGQPLRVHASLSMVRVAPGLGVEAYKGEIAGVQTILDARAGFVVFASSQTIKGEEVLQGRERSGGNSFVQPWLGARATFILLPRWRIMVDGSVQGLGVDGGSEGWGASIIASYAVTTWMDVSLGFRALDSVRGKGPGNLPGADRRSFSILAYGPVVGVNFRF